MSSPATRIRAEKVQREGGIAKCVDMVYEVLRESDQKWIVRYRLVYVDCGDGPSLIVKTRYNELGMFDIDRGVCIPDVIFHRMTRAIRTIFNEKRKP